MDEKFLDTINNAVDRDREYHHTAEKDIETNKKKKSVKRTTSYKSAPKKHVDIETYRKLALICAYALGEAVKVDPRGPYIDNVINAATDLVETFTVVD